jgi:uncharacterized protein
VLRRLLLSTLLTFASFAADFTQLKPQGYLSDFARVVDPASKTRIERYCRQIQDKTGVEMALVTLATLDGDPIEDVANQIFRTWGVGQKTTNEGILLLLAVRERQSRLEVGYGIEPYIPDGFAGSILREMRPALRESHYGDALISAAGRIGDRVLEAKRVGEDARPQPPATSVFRPNAWMHYWPFGLFAGLLLFSLFASSRSRRRRRFARYGGGGVPWWIFTNPGSWGGGGGTSHGGFGGSDGVGGFGGFGGGDSGGGGASSDW